MCEFNGPFFDGFNWCGDCGFYPFGIFGGMLPYADGLFPFSFYPFLYDAYLYMVPYSLASGLWHPFFPPFYLGAGSLLPYPGFVPSLGAAIPPLP